MDLARLFRARYDLHVIVGDKVCHDDLNLSRREKAPWACPNSVAEVNVVDARAAVLKLHFVAGMLAQLGEAEAIEFLGRVPQIGAHVNGMCADHDGVTLRDDVAGGSTE